MFCWKNLKAGDRLEDVPVDDVIKTDFKEVERCVPGLFGSARTCNSPF
jgi:hypothetical protein